MPSLREYPLKCRNWKRHLASSWKYPYCSEESHLLYKEQYYHHWFSWTGAGFCHETLLMVWGQYKRALGGLAVTSTHLCFWVWRRRELLLQYHWHLWLLHVWPTKEGIINTWRYICFYIYYAHSGKKSYHIHTSSWDSSRLKAPTWIITWSSLHNNKFRRFEEVSATTKNTHLPKKTILN